MTKDNKILVAELLGTMLLTGAVLWGANPFITLGILVLRIGGISGSNVNPAVTMGMAFMKKISTETLVKFWVVQVIGAYVARIVYNYLKGNDFDLSLTFETSSAELLVAEILGAAIFLLGVTLAIGQKLDGIRLAVAIGGSLMIGAYLGGIVNPAIAIGLGTVTLANLVGPLIGAVLGTQLGQVLTSKK